MSHRLTRSAALVIATLAVPAFALAQGTAAPAGTTSPSGGGAGAPATTMPTHPSAGAAQATTPGGGSPHVRANAPEQVEQRITTLHSELKITPAQEPQWEQFATAMRDNAASMRASFEARSNGYGGMNADQNLQNYAQMAELHAQNMQKLAAAFSPLYQGMSPDQQKIADTVFRPTNRRESRRSSSRSPASATHSGSPEGVTPGKS